MATLRQRLADFAAPVLLSAAAVACANACAGAGALQGVCRELLAGTTEGRQALVGSCWYGPVPTLACLPFAWILGGAGDLALSVAAWFFWALALLLAGRMAVHPLVRLLLQGMLIAGIVAGGAVRDPAMAVVSAVTLQGFRSAIGWWTSRRVKDLVTLGFCLALLAGCGLPQAGMTVILAACIPLAALQGAETRRRMAAILLLGWLPVLYALAVWMLANWLILDDPVFFLRSLAGRHGPAWRHFRLAWTQPAEILGVLACLAACAGALVRRSPAALTAAVIGLLTWLWVNVLRALGVGWAAAPSLTAGVIAGALALWLSRLPDAREKPLFNAWGDLFIFVMVAFLAWRQAPVAALDADWAGSKSVSREVEAFVESRTPYGRVFACGYEGLRLLDGYTGDRILPNLDLYVGGVRRLYYGQHLFLLVHRPVGLAAMDNVHVRYPWLYESGGSRSIYARDFGPWRLFEIVGAPTEEQLRSWRQR